MARRAARTCEVTELFRLLGSPYVLDMLHFTLKRKDAPSRFKELQEGLDISPNTLTERLKALVNAGLLDRQAFQEIPPRVEYRASPKALELWPIFETLGAWSKRNDLRAAGVAPAPPA